MSQQYNQCHQFKIDNYPSNQSIFSAYITISCKDPRSTIQNAYPPFFKNVSSDIIVSGSGTLLNREWVLFSMSPLCYFSNEINKQNKLPQSRNLNSERISIRDDTNIICYFSHPPVKKSDCINNDNNDDNEGNDNNEDIEDVNVVDNSISVPVIELIHLNCERQKKWIAALMGKNLSNISNVYNAHPGGWHFGWNTSQDNLFQFGSMVLGRLQYPLDELCNEENPYKKIWRNHDWIYSDHLVTGAIYGKAIYSFGSPFGITSPDTFQNSVSKGIVCNVIGSSQPYIILTDARMLPGCEGGPIIAKCKHKMMGDEDTAMSSCFDFSNSRNHSKCKLLGVNSLPLRNVNEKVEMNMGYTYGPLRLEIIKYLTERINRQNIKIMHANNNLNQEIEWNNQYCKDSLNHSHPKPLKDAIESVVRVQVSNSWASGILLQSTLGKRFVLTNAHVFAPFIEANNGKRQTSRSQFGNGRSISLSHRIVITQHKIASNAESHTFLGDLIGIVDQGPLDLALLSVTAKPEEGYSKGIILNYKERLRTGESIFIVGHPLYDPNLNLKPTVTQGTLAKVVRYSGIPTLIQTSALVHGGNSGGLVVSKEGKMIGIVTSNANLYDPITRSNKLIPSLNFAIPVSRMQDIQKFMEGGLSEIELDEALNRMDKAVTKVWAIQGSESTLGGEIPREINSNSKSRKGALLQLFEELQSQKPQHMIPKSKL